MSDETKLIYYRMTAFNVEEPIHAHQLSFDTGISQRRIRECIAEINKDQTLGYMIDWNNEGYFATLDPRHKMRLARTKILEAVKELNKGVHMLKEQQYEKPLFELKTETSRGFKALSELLD